MRTIKRVLVLIVMAVSLSFLFPSEGSSQVMFVGTKVVTLKGGIPYRGEPFYTKGSFRTGVEYAEYLKGGNYWSVGVDVELNNIPKKEFFIPELTATATGGYNLFLLGDFARRINLYGTAGITLGYAVMNNDKAELIDGDILAKTQSFVYGGKIGLHTDIYLTSNFSLTMGTGTYLLWGTLSGNVVRPYFEGGIKISFF